MAKYNKNVEIDVTSKNASDGDGKILSFYGFKQNGDGLKALDRLLLPGNGPFRKPNPSKNIAMATYKGGGLHVKVMNDKVQDFLNTGFKSILSSLISSGNYDNDKLMHLYDQTEFALTSSMSKDEMNKLYGETEMSVVDMWTSYLNNINDPEMRKQLELYSQIFGNTIYGHALSLKNVMAIRAIDAKTGSKATFVLGKTKWAEFGRGVKAGAKKYPLWMFVNKNDASAQDIAKAQEELGHGLEQFGDLGVAVQDAIKIEAQKMANTKTKKIPMRYIGYDISDTYLYNPKEDLLNVKPNISGNIVYTLNQLAQEAEAKKSQERGDIDKDEAAKMNERTNLALQAVEDICQKNGINTDINGTPDAKVADLLMQYFTKRITDNKKTFNILKPENANIYAQDGVQLTLIMTNVALGQLSRFKHSLQYTQKEAATLAPIIRYAVQAIGNATVKNVNESKTLIKENFLSDFKAALKKLGIRIIPNSNESSNVENPVSTENQDNMAFESIKKDFNNILDRINNPIIY